MVKQTAKEANNSYVSLRIFVGKRVSLDRDFKGIEINFEVPMDSHTDEIFDYFKKIAESSTETMVRIPRFSYERISLEEQRNLEGYLSEKRGEKTFETRVIIEHQNSVWYINDVISNLAQRIEEYIFSLNSQIETCQQIISR